MSWPNMHVKIPSGGLLLTIFDVNKVLNFEKKHDYP